MRDKRQVVLKTKSKVEKVKAVGVSGILSRFYRQILEDLAIDVFKFNALLQKYVLDPRHGVPNNRRFHTSARGNLLKELQKPHMTFKVFIKGLRLLEFKQITFSIQATHVNGRITLHETKINLGELPADDSEIPEDQEYIEPVHCLEPVDETDSDYEDGVSEQIK